MRSEIAHIRLISVLFLIISTMAGSALCQEELEIDGDYVAKGDDWRFMISPYAFLASQSTDVGGTKLRQSFDDLHSLTNFGVQLVGSVTYRDWILTADGTYASLESSSERSLLDVNMQIKQYMLDLRLGYLVLNRVDYEDQADVVRGWSLQVNAGAKYWRNEMTLGYELTFGDPPPLAEGEIQDDQSWWDPLVGATARIYLSRTVLLGVSASGGGFGIGNASDISWDFMYVNTFKVSRRILISAGFRSFHYRRMDGEGENELETKVSVYGPLLGVSIAF